MRTRPITGLSLAIAAALLVGASTAHAALTTEGCLAKKSQAQGKFQQCRANENAKALQGKPASLNKCTIKFQEKIAALNEKASDKGIGCRYSDNGDGTVTDYDTGLQWEKKTSPAGAPDPTDPHDVDVGRTWNSSGTLPDGTAFTQVLGRLNTCSIHSGLGFGSLGFASHCDWRLPTREELQSILLEPFPCGTSPCIDPIFGPTVNSAAPIAIYWSSTTVADSATSAWTVDFADGEAVSTSKGAFFIVRAVRGGL
jgi:hypothetical protein